MGATCGIDYEPEMGRGEYSNPIINWWVWIVYYTQSPFRILAQEKHHLFGFKPLSQVIKIAVQIKCLTRYDCINC